MLRLTWVISSCVLILVVIALRAAFGKRLQPVTRYALWAVVLLRLLLPFEIGGSPWSVAAAVQKSKLPEASQTVVAWRNIAGSPDLSIPRPDPSLSREEWWAQYEINQAEWEAQMAEAGTVDATPVTVTDVVNWVWYAGMAVTALVFLVRNLRFYLLLRKRRKPLAADCAVKVYTVENLSSSCLFGRAIYISAGTAEDETKLRHVLAHEMSHYRHGDHVWALLRCAALALHWYNPLVWWAAALSRQDAELFADEGALKRLGEDAREAYGATLIALSARCKNSASLLCTATTMTNGKKALKERITLIAKKPHTPLAVAVVISIVAALAVCGTLAGAQTEPETQEMDFRDIVREYNPIETAEATSIFYPHEMVILDTTSDADWRAYATVWDGGEEDIQSIYALYQTVEAERLPSKEVPEYRTFPIYQVTLHDNERNVSLVFSVSADGYFTRNGAFERETANSLFAAVDAAVRRWRSGEAYFAAQDAHEHWGPASNSDLQTVAPARVTDDFPKTPPMLTVVAQEQSVTAWRGIYTWGYENSDGTQTEIRADIDYPRVWRYEFPALSTNPDGIDHRKANDAFLLFSQAPNGLEIRCWRESDWGVTAGEPVPWEPGTDAPYFELREGGYIYEITAHWDVPGEYQGIVRYCFYGTYRVPVTGVPGYEMDAFYLDIPLFLERIQAADFDWSIALSVSEEYTFYLLWDLTHYITENELADAEFSALLRCTTGLDGAYAEGYDSAVLDALYRKDSARYLRLWAELDGGQQRNAIPFSVYEQLDFPGWEAALQWMKEHV